MAFQSETFDQSGLAAAVNTAYDGAASLAAGLTALCIAVVGKDTSDADGTVDAMTPAHANWILDICKYALQTGLVNSLNAAEMEYLKDSMNALAAKAGIAVVFPESV
jgi:hypothetical protein